MTKRILYICGHMPGASLDENLPIDESRNELCPDCKEGFSTDWRDHKTAFINQINAHLSMLTQTSDPESFVRHLGIIQRLTERSQEQLVGTNTIRFEFKEKK